MKILITNDDGINAVGIRSLAKKLMTYHEVTVIAPDRERSAQSHSITIHDPLTYEEVDLFGKRAFAVSGTPCDCVKLGILSILQSKPDLVISGINNGPNLANDIIYSGTVAAAYEASYLGVQSIAISMNYWNLEQVKIDLASAWLSDNLNALLNFGLDKRTVININYPANPSKGVKICEVGHNYYTDRYEPVENGLMLRGELIESHGFFDSDIDWSYKDYITISPLSNDRNDFLALRKMHEKGFGKE